MSLKHTFELPKTERKKVMTFESFSKNKAQDPKQALKDGGKAEKLKKSEDNTKGHDLSKGLKVTKAVFENYTEVGEMAGQLHTIQDSLENTVDDLQRIGGDLFRKGFETYSEKIERISSGITSAIDGFSSVFTDLDNEEPTDVQYPKKGETSELLAEDDDPIAKQIDDLNKQIDTVAKEKDMNLKRVAELEQQISKLTVQRAGLETNLHIDAINKIKTAGQTGQPGQPAQPGQVPTVPPTPVAPVATPAPTA